MKIYFNGQFVEEEKAKVSVKTHALQYGTGIFEGIRAYYNESTNSYTLFRAVEHFKRMEQSGKVLFMHLPNTPEELVDITKKLIQKNFAKQDLYIRPFLYKSDETIGSFNLKKLTTSFCIYTLPMGRYHKNTKGLRVHTTTWRRIPDFSIPARAKISGSYVNTALAKTESELNGFDEALFTDLQGHIVEGSAENIFVIKDNTIITPPSSEDILVGITRHTVITILKDAFDLPVVERSIDRTELYQADEILLVGTGAEVSPVIEVDNRPIGNGKYPIAQKVKEIYTKLVHGQYDTYTDWTLTIKEK